MEFLLPSLPASLPPSLFPYLGSRKSEVTGVLRALDKEHIDHAHAAFGEQVFVLGQDALDVGDDLEREGGREGGKEGGRERCVVDFHGLSNHLSPPSPPPFLLSPQAAGSPAAGRQRCGRRSWAGSRSPSRPESP